MKPRLLDAFCCAGGTSYGYHQAGFEVVGVDHEPQPRFPFEFHQDDALEFIAKYGHEFDVIGASPPCQVHSVTASLSNGNHPDLIAPTRKALIGIGKPYVIENVPGAPLINPLMLCGTMFGLRVIRHRLFEIWPEPIWFPPASCCHWSKINRNGFVTMFGNGASRDKGGNVAAWKAASNIDWMTVSELSQAVPPAYTKWIGERLLEMIGAVSSYEQLNSVKGAKIL